jgi:hypothetical protein
MQRIRLKMSRIRNTFVCDAVLQVAQQELEVVRASSGDRELVDHIKGLEEQLASKSQELQKQRNAHLYIQEIKVYSSFWNL